MSGAENRDRKRSGYLRQVNLDEADSDNDRKRTRLQSKAAAATTTTTRAPKKTALDMVFQMESIDKLSGRLKRETLGPMPFIDLVKELNKKFLQLHKEFPYSQTVKRLLEGFSDAKIQPITIALNNPVYGFPLRSLPKCNDLEPCALNNGQNMVLARISEKNEIVVFLRIHPIKDNYKLFTETPVLVPEWLETDVRETMTDLIESGHGMLRYHDRNAPQNAYVNHVKASIATGSFCEPYSDIKYLHQFQCPTIFVCFEPPTPKIEEIHSPRINGMFIRLPPLNMVTPASPNLLDGFFPTNDVFKDLFNPPAKPTSLAFPSSLASSFDGVNSSLDIDFLEWPDFVLSSPTQETTSQITQSSSPVIFRQQANSSSNNIIKTLPQQNYRY
jgi:hypothetical protein